MAVVLPVDVWVDMRVGQPVEIGSDVYGHSVKYHGKLVGLSAGTGSAFALLGECAPGHAARS